MSSAELALYISFLRHSRRYVEFGVGGTTVQAAAHVKDSVIAIDSAQAWIERVRLACEGARVRPEFIWIDIGPVKAWGVPSDADTKPRWSSYHRGVWTRAGIAEADLFLVDGRFRVACFAQIVLHCRPDATIGVHDFASRPHYHVIRDIGREISSAEDMSFFLPRSAVKRRARELAEEYKEEPA
jgi:hypothetical protein